MIVIVAGVSGSGKTTVGSLLASELGWPYADGDSLHPPANVAKMASGQPLTDADRVPWLAAIGSWIDARLAHGEAGVLACSALKRRYRAALLDGRPSVTMAFLLIDYEVAASRLAARRDHFFRPELLASQFTDLEPPADDEADVVSVPVVGGPQELVAEILRRLGVFR